MKRKVARLRLSPNEEAQLIREEHERRRKLRIQQVREQERCISLQIRRDVQQRRERELHNLEEALREDWTKQQKEKLDSLQTLYQESLLLVGQGHRSAKENVPDLAAAAQREGENHARAEERHREALRELQAQRQRGQEEQSRSIKARRKALQAEKERSAKVASLPPPPPNPIENIESKKQPMVKKSDINAFSATHYHMPETAVDREADTVHPNAQEVAEVEVWRLQELGRDAEREREEQQEKARLRGKHALRREQLTQDHGRLLVELEHMQQTDMLRRRQQVAQMPAQIFQPLYKRQEAREDGQREMEFAFEDMYTGERRVKGDLVLQLVPAPLPALSTDSQDLDQELDLTLEDVTTTHRAGETRRDTTHQAGSTEQEAPTQGEPSRPAGAPPRRTLKKLLDRIRSQRDQWTSQGVGVCPTEQPTTTTAPQVPEQDMTIDTGSLSSSARLPGPPQSPPASETKEESIVAGTLLPPEVQADRIHEEERRRREAELETEKQQQVTLLQQLDEQKTRLEQMLLDTRQEKETRQAAMTQEVPVHHQEVTPIAPGSAAEPVAAADEDDHTRRIREYQQRLMEQNRLHHRSVEAARRRLEEYQRALHIRYNLTATSAPSPAVPPPLHSAGVAAPLGHPLRSAGVAAPLGHPLHSAGVTAPLGHPLHSAGVAAPLGHPLHSAGVAAPLGHPLHSAGVAAPIGHPLHSAGVAAPIGHPLRSAGVTAPLGHPLRSAGVTAPLGHPLHSAGVTAPLGHPLHSAGVTAPLGHPLRSAGVTAPLGHSLHSAGVTAPLGHPLHSAGVTAPLGHPLRSAGVTAPLGPSLHSAGVTAPLGHPLHSAGVTAPLGHPLHSAGVAAPLGHPLRSAGVAVPLGHPLLSARVAAPLGHPLRSAGVDVPPVHPLQLPTGSAMPAHIPEANVQSSAPTRNMAILAQPPSHPSSGLSSRASLGIDSRAPPVQLESSTESPRDQRAAVAAWLTGSIMERVTDHLPERLRPPSVTVDHPLYRPLTTEATSTIPPPPRSDPIPAARPSMLSLPGQASFEPGLFLQDSPREDMDRQKQELQEVYKRVQEQRGAMAQQQREQEEARRRQEEEREQMRRQREALQALINTDAQPASEVADEAMMSQDTGELRLRLLASLLRAIEDSNEGTLSSLQDDRVEQPLLSRDSTPPQSDTLTGPAPPAPVPPRPDHHLPPKPPVARVRLGFMEMMMSAQHELSAIQEVETPTNASLVTGPDDVRVLLPPTSATAPQEESEPSVVSDVSVEMPLHSTSGSSVEQSAGRGTASGAGSGGSSKLSWRERLMMEAGTSPEPGPDDVRVLLPPTSATAPQEESEPSVVSDVSVETLLHSTSGSSVEQSAGRGTASGAGSGGSSKLSWRERLMMEAGTSPEPAAAPPSRSQFSSDSGRGGTAGPGPVVTGYTSSPESTHRRLDPACLSSTTISTGSYITTDPEQNFCHTEDTSLLLARLGVEGGSGGSGLLDMSHPSSHSSYNDDKDQSGPGCSYSQRSYEGDDKDLSGLVPLSPAIDSLFNSSSIQRIIDKYTRELDISLNTTASAADREGSSLEGPSVSEAQRSCAGGVQEERPAYSEAWRSCAGGVQEDRPADSPSLPLDTESGAQRRGLEWVNQMLERFSDQASSLAPGQESSFHPLIGQPADESSCLAADQRDSPMARLIGPPTAHSSMVAPGTPCQAAPASADQGGWDSTLGRMIGRLSHQSSSQWLSGGRDFYAGQLIGQAELERLSWFDGGQDESQMRPLLGELDESGAQRSGSSGERDSVDPGCSAQSSVLSAQVSVPEAQSHSSAVPGLDLQDQTLQRASSPQQQDPGMSGVSLASDCFHPLLAEVTQNETVDPSMTFHLPEQEVSSSSTGSGHPGLSAHFQGLTEEEVEVHDDLSLTSDPSPERFRAAESSSSLPTTARLQESLYQITAAGEKGILEESQLTLVSLTDTTLPDQDTTIEKEMEEEWEEEEREEGQKTKKEEEPETTLLPEETEENKESSAVMLLEFHWSPSTAEQQATQQKRRALHQRSAQRVEDMKSKRAMSENTKTQAALGPVSTTKPKGTQCQAEDSTTKPKGTQCQAEDKSSETAGLISAEGSKLEEPQLPLLASKAGLKKVGEVRICTPEQRKQDVSAMHQRTQRLYDQLEEVKQQKEIRGRQESNTRNRQKAKEFQKKTLQKLRAQQTPR